MDRTPSGSELEMANIVRAEHANGGRCTQCPETGRCERYAAWIPIIVDLLSAERQP